VFFTSYLKYVLVVVNNEISVFWGSLVKHGVTKEERKWTLKDDARWIGGMKTFYDRERYDILIANCDKNELVLVMGTPGIGKTMFSPTLIG
jgi:hypothetical protein